MSNDTTPTPRTDAEAREFDPREAPPFYEGSLEFVEADFARTLERELAEAKAEAEKRLEETSFFADENKRLDSENAELRKDRERMREALGESSGFVARLLGAFGRQMMQKDRDRAEAIMTTSRDLRHTAMEGGER